VRVRGRGGREGQPRRYEGLGFGAGVGLRSLSGLSVYPYISRFPVTSNISDALRAS